MPKRGKGLVAAAERGDIEGVRKALQSRAPVNVRSGPDNQTALIDASRNGHIDVMRMLIEAGADLHLYDAYGKTALIRACEQGRLEAVRLLLDEGVQVDFKQYEICTLSDGCTALMHAAANDQIAVAELLLAHGADIHTGDSHGETALMKASERGNLAMTEFLLEKGANPAALDKSGESALDYSERFGFVRVSELLRSAVKHA